MLVLGNPVDQQSAIDGQRRHVNGQISVVLPLRQLALDLEARLLLDWAPTARRSRRS